MANFETLLVFGKNPKETFRRELKIIAENDKKKGDFEQGRMFGRVAEILIANTSSELVEMDFAGYGDFATSLRIQDAFSCFSVIVFMGTKKNKLRKWYGGARFRIGRRCLGRLKSRWREKIPDSLGKLSRNSALRAL